MPQLPEREHSARRFSQPLAPKSLASDVDSLSGKRSTAKQIRGVEAAITRLRIRARPYRAMHHLHLLIVRKIIRMLRIAKSLQACAVRAEMIECADVRGLQCHGHRGSRLRLWPALCAPRCFPFPSPAGLCPMSVRKMPGGLERTLLARL